MKKPIMTFLALLVLAFGITAFVEISKIGNHAAIAKSPGFVAATPEGITKKTKNSRDTFQVNFTYAAAGSTYKIDSHWMDTQAEALAFGSGPVQIAFATTAPADGIFKREFDQRDPKEGIMSALITAAGLGLLGAFLGTLALLWQLPWLRRSHP